jgi:integrase/recombinase XerD
VRVYLDHLTVERGLSTNTISSYRRDLQRYLNALAVAGVGALDGVTPAVVGGYVAGLRTGDAHHRPLAIASTARAVSAVRGLHRFAVRDGLASDDPTADLPPPILPRRLPKALEVEQVARLLGSASHHDPLSLRDRALLEFLYGTGARISEAVGCRLDDLDRADESVRLRGKGGKARVVPVGGYALAAIDAYLVRGRPTLLGAGTASGTKAGMVFLNSRGGQLSRQSAWTIIRRAAQRAGISTASVSPHILRHSFATHLLDGGADVRVVQELLGHASVTTTQVYTLVTVDKLREVYAAYHPRARG